MDVSTATLIVAIISASIAFAMLVLKIVEVARRRSCLAGVGLAPGPQLVG